MATGLWAGFCGGVPGVPKRPLTMEHDDEDDWAPLSDEQLAQRPGEFESPVVFQETPTKAKAPVAPLRERGPDKPLTARQEKMLRELQERVAKAGPGTSLIAQVQQREQRTLRKQQAAKKVTEQLEATCVVGELPAEPEPVLELSKQADADPRELEPWFQELPENERERLRQAWHDERHKFDNTGEIALARLQRAACYGALAFFCMGILMVLLVGGFFLIPAMTFAGAVAGAGAQLLGGGRFLYAGCGLIGYFCVLGPYVLGNPFLLYGALLVAFVMGAVGMDGEMRRSAGYVKD